MIGIGIGLDWEMGMRNVMMRIGLDGQIEQRDNSVMSAYYIQGN